MKTIPAQDWVVQRTLQEFPEAIQAFVSLRTKCVGCLMARFCTLQSVEKSFHLAPGSLIQEIQNHLEKIPYGGLDENT